jgi:hypothetical protein
MTQSWAGILGIVRVYRVHGPQSVAGFRDAHVEGVPPQPAVRLHQDPISSAPIGRTPGFDEVVKEMEAPDRPARRDGTRTALAAARRDDHDRAAMLAVFRIDVL